MYMHMCMYIYILYLCLCLYLYMYMYMNTFIHLHVHIYIYIYMYIEMRTYPYKYTHICVHTFRYLHTYILHNSSETGIPKLSVASYRTTEPDLGATETQSSFTGFPILACGDERDRSPRAKTNRCHQQLQAPVSCFAAVFTYAGPLGMASS